MSLIHWIKNGSDCENCRWMWETCTSNEDGTEYDCGCWIKGDSYDETECRLVNPFKFVVGCLRKKRRTYCWEHEYDGYEEFMNENDKREQWLHESIMDQMSKYTFYEERDDEFKEVDLSEILRDEVTWIRSSYYSKAHPFVHKSLVSEWKELLVKTCSTFLDMFKPYFCK